MPTAKAVNSYPIELIAVVERVLTENTEVHITLKDKRELSALRMQVYGLRKALSDEGSHPLQASAAQLSTRSEVNEDGKHILTICTVDKLVPDGLREAAGGL